MWHLSISTWKCCVYEFHRCHFSAFLLSDTEEQPSRAGSKSVTCCQLPGSAGRPEGYPLLLVTQFKAMQKEKEVWLYLPLPAVCPRWLVSIKALGKTYQQQLSRLFKKLIIGLQASPTQKDRGKEEGKRKTEKGNRWNEISPQLWNDSSHLLGDSSSSINSSFTTMFRSQKNRSDFWICMQTLMCSKSLLPQLYFHVTERELEHPQGVWKVYIISCLSPFIKVNDLISTRVCSNPEVHSNIDWAAFLRHGGPFWELLHYNHWLPLCWVVIWITDSHFVL